ncbi:ImuA family protein [Pedobacter frigoris]|uniref:Error-prone repair protein ImuA n=1 Tax=Pedobacter frigoris TaxID=2571272 RepID=A0A4U1CHY8_9SPHI|nr:Error-prone repair protein ImuA [Pedobacter frigoris]TKC06227.1 Error-prone repair protein ImuA [Pedobacter frigoris]
MNATKELIDKLQQDILHWQGFKQQGTASAEAIGLGAIECAFPNGVFPKKAIHEFITVEPEHAAASAGFIAGILKTLLLQGGVCLWISTSRTFFPPSLIAFNVAPEQVIFVDAKAEKEVLWVMEQALKCGGLAAVIAEVKEINIIQSRRLQLAIESSKVTGFLLRNDPQKLGSNTCVARWKITPLPSVLEDELPGVGFPRWQVDLLRVRNGNPGSWKLEWVQDAFRPVVDVVEKEEAVVKLMTGHYA